jgi:HEXXH motif-containing protein
LYHPCATALTSVVGDARLQRDFQMAVWTASHSKGIPLGAVNAPRPLWAWAPDGGRQVTPGRHDLEELSARLEGASSPATLALDVWCDSMGVPQRHSWAADPPTTPEAGDRLKEDILSFLRSVALADALLRRCMTWVTAVTSVAVPLRSVSPDQFRSVSSPDLPGVVALDLKPTAIVILEALVHESAHHYLYLCEAEAPLVDPAHEGKYRSPLRPEPRPLRGILLAYHALSFIGVLYADAEASGFLTEDEYQADRAQLQTMLDDAEATLFTHRRHLSPSGNTFLDATAEVAIHGRRP